MLPVSDIFWRNLGVWHLEIEVLLRPLTNQKFYFIFYKYLTDKNVVRYYKKIPL